VGDSALASVVQGCDGVSAIVQDISRGKKVPSYAHLRATGTPIVHAHDDLRLLMHSFSY
jgi:hypothetical protein